MPIFVDASFEYHQRPKSSEIFSASSFHSEFQKVLFCASTLVVNSVDFRLEAGTTGCGTTYSTSTEWVTPTNALATQDR
jgi:hypothetical protein